jgi:hypothetical protein
VTPTRYPTWRSLAFAIAIVEILSLAVMFGRGGLRELPATRMLQVSLISQGLTLIGAWTMRSRPAGGFMLFGTGFLLLAGLLAALLPWERPLAIPVTALLAPGLLYVWLGMKQR